MKKLRAIAIHLPQFHPVPENDEWWGKGFTEWTNVAKAKPLFKGHYQPHLPSDLGYYDLRLEESRIAQADIARSHGIEGFCYYHYWFNGKRILERPMNEILESKKPDFPFMLCWANENWNRGWNGAEYDVLLKQEYSDQDDINHIQYLLEIFKDKRYIRIDNKPVIAIYRSTKLPNPKKTINLWRDEARKHNLELYICRFESFSEEGKDITTDVGFDAAIDFQPKSKFVREIIEEKGFAKKILRKVQKRLHWESPKFFKKLFYNAKNHGSIVTYDEYVNKALNRSLVSYKLFPCITPMWDNSARKKEGYIIIKNSTPNKYANWLKTTLQNFTPFSKEENLVFINAWNEWAEGNHLEPCHKWKNEYLKFTKQELDNLNHNNG